MGILFKNDFSAADSAVVPSTGNLLYFEHEKQKKMIF
jgi:hypothetical protein